MATGGRPPKELPEAFALAANGFTASQIARELNANYGTVRYWAQRKGVELTLSKQALRPVAVRAIALAKEGYYAAEIARLTGMSIAGVFKLFQREGVTAGKCPAQLPDADRAQKMASMYRQGLTLEKIGAHFGMTRERVRQILAKLGLNGRDGGQAKSAALKVQASQAKRDAASLARYGISYEEKKRRRADGTLAAYEQQKHNAASRGIAWGLTFAAWLAVWVESGKLEFRGRGKGHYVMSRLKDEGGYVLGNVHIQLSTDNNREGLAKCRENKSLVPGVWKIYPSDAKPFVAHLGKHKLCRFATQEEAIEARERAGMTSKRGGRGYAILRDKKRGRVSYQVQIRGRYIGTYKTPEAALAARAAALAETARSA